MIVYQPFAISMGSNQGQSVDRLKEAVRQLDRSKGIQRLRVSSLYRSKAMQTQSDHDFLNAVYLGQTSLNPFELHKILMDLETAAGRRRTKENLGPPYSDRELDLDLLFYGRQTVNESDLNIPHPRMEGRGFVLVPLCETCPYWKHPSKGWDLCEMVDALDDKHWVKMEEELWVQ